MRISVLCRNLTSNSLGRAHLLTEVLDRNHEVEIAGIDYGQGVWEPLEDKWDYKRLGTTASIAEFPRRAASVTDQLTGDVIVACKPRTTSYGLALIKRYRDGTPVILDIDDWDTGLMHTDSRLKSHVKKISQLNNVNKGYYIQLLEKISNRADELIVSNTFLQDKFGGTVVPHVRDTDTFDPEKFDKEAIRDEFGLPQEKTIVMFSGTPREHKGVDDLIRAINSIENGQIIGVIVGVQDSQYARYLRKLAGDRVIFVGPQPFDLIPKWVAAADIITIPQKRSQATRGQLPAKLFDAMAMGKPIIGTNVSDIPKILEGCGIVVEPDSSDAIAEEITRLHENPALREELGRKARERCVEEYSYDAYEPVLEEIITDAIENHK
ncbi:glycosyltransferase family 4 protein [Natronorubrum thiooxidans]|nr:glycosyltransferase family 4 protein [Natronorubrum thiooxidans]